MCSSSSLHKSNHTLSLYNSLSSSLPQFSLLCLSFSPSSVLPRPSLPPPRYFAAHLPPPAWPPLLRRAPALLPPCLIGVPSAQPRRPCRLPCSYTDLLQWCRGVLRVSERTPSRPVLALVLLSSDAGDEPVASTWLWRSTRFGDPDSR